MLHRRKTQWDKFGILVVVMAILISCLASCKGKSAVLATYKGGEVTEQQFNDYIAFHTLFGDKQIAMFASIPQMKEEIVKQYVVTKVLGEKISEEDRKIIKQSAQDFGKQIKTARNTQKELKQQIDKSGLDLAKAEEIYREALSFQTFYKEKGEELKKKIPDGKVKKMFEKNPKDYNVLTLRHILIGLNDPETGKKLKSDKEAVKEADQIKKKLEAGGDWTKLAKQYSADKGSKENGGLYENQVAKTWVKEFKEAANKQPIGKVGPPVQTEYGYHIIKVEKREQFKSADQLSKIAKDAILEESVTNNLNNWIQGEQKKLNIKVSLPQPSSTPTVASPKISSKPGK